jgi:hypothetical protein
MSTPTHAQKQIPHFIRLVTPLHWRPCTGDWPPGCNNRVHGPTWPSAPHRCQRGRLGCPAGPGTGSRQPVSRRGDCAWRQGAGAGLQRIQLQGGVHAPGRRCACIGVQCSDSCSAHITWAVAVSVGVYITWLGSRGKYQAAGSALTSNAACRFHSAAGSIQLAWHLTGDLSLRCGDAFEAVFMLPCTAYMHIHDQALWRSPCWCPSLPLTTAAWPYPP